MGLLKMHHTRRRSVPFGTVLLTTIALLLYLFPAVNASLVFERNHIGQIWRLVTCHFVHWNFEHLAWSVGTFWVLGILSEKENREAFLGCVGLSALSIPIALWMLMTNLEHYGGLSGIDSALFVLIAVGLIREKRQAGDRLLVCAGVLVLGAFLGKIGVEFFTSNPVFVSEGSGLAPVPLAHLVGGVVGAAVASLPRAALRLPWALL